MAFNFPDSPAVGEAFQQWIWDGQKWLIASTSGDTTIAAAPPMGAQTGDLWWDNDSGALYIYYFDGSSSQWVAVLPSGLPASSALPLMDGVAASGVASTYARGDHKHPSDTSRASVADLAAYAPLASPALTGAPTAPTPAVGDNTQRLATTEFVTSIVISSSGAVPSNAAPQANGTAAPGASGLYSRGDHVHPTDVTRAPLASPAFTGIPTAPTPVTGASDLRVANAAFVTAALTGRNRVINGRFQVSQQYGAGGFGGASYSYGTDMWRMLVESGTVFLYSQRTDFSATFATNGYMETPTVNQKLAALQFIELAEMRDLAGTVTTLSALISVSNVVNISNVKMAILQWVGAADVVTNPISAWGAAGTNPTLAANWSYVNAPVNLGVSASVARYSVSGAVGVSARNLAVLIWIDSKNIAGGDSIKFSDVQLEAGASATRYEARSYISEQALCRRYWRTNSQIMGAFGGGAATGVIASEQFGGVLMRAAPTVTIKNATSTIVDIDAAFRNIASQSSVGAVDGCSVSLVSATAGTAFKPCQLSAGALTYDARL